MIASPIPALSASDEERFLSKVVTQPDGCWEWQGKLDSGYGRFWLQTRWVYAHRAAYQHWIGAVDVALQLDHLCRNRSCVNPAHLEPVTSRENTARGQNRVAHHMVQTHCLRGHPLSGDNLCPRPEGQRACRACRDIRDRERRARKKPGLRSDDLDGVMAGTAGPHVPPHGRRAAVRRPHLSTPAVPLRPSG